MKLCNVILKILKNTILETTECVFTNCDHLYDRSWAQPTIIPSWNNVHGYFSPLTKRWYAAVDMRVCGVRVQDIVIVCQEKDRYDYWIGMMKDSNKCIDAVRENPSSKRGSEINRCYTFNTSDGNSKSYNITGKDDFFLED